MSKKRNTRNTKKARKQLKGKLAGEIKAVTSLPPQGKDGIYYTPGIPKQAVRATIQKVQIDRHQHPNSDAVIHVSRTNPGETAIAWYDHSFIEVSGKSALDLFVENNGGACVHLPDKPGAA